MVPSEYVPIALKLVICPLATDDVVGVSAMPVSTIGAVTVKVALLEVMPFL